MKRIGAFISIPKCASKTVLSTLELGRNRDVENTDSLVIYENHQRGEVLSRKYDLDPLFVFCFSRNPYDRCISWYEYHQSLHPYHTMTFDEWVKQGLPHHWTTQNATNYVEEGLSPLLQYNFVRNCKVDFIGRMENFSDDLRTVIEKLNNICIENGLAHRFTFTDQKRNAGPQKGGNHYTGETKALVHAILAKDFEYFGYDK